MASVYRSKANQGLERKGQNDIYYSQLRANKREENKVERHQNEISDNMHLFSRKFSFDFKKPTFIIPHLAPKSLRN